MLTHLCQLFGVTRISLLHYSLATFLGLLPLTTAYCWIGSELRSLKDVLSSSGKNPVERYVWLGGAVGGTLLVTVVVTLITRNAINAALAKKMVRVPCVCVRVCGCAGVYVRGFVSCG